MNTTTDDIDRRFMAAALRLGRRNLGQTWPNPAVGALVVDGGRILGRGWTAPGGRPHAEPQALAEAGEAARGATVYVTLEPCAHHGRTPPCVDAIVAAGISRLVVGIGDPDERVAGAGLARLRDAGIEVTENVCREAALWANIGHITRIRRGRPFVQLKMAHTAQGFIAPATGQPLRITGAVADQWVQRMRAEADAILVGAGTVRADDPRLTCRIAGLEGASPLRVVADPALTTPPSARLLTGLAQTPTWIFCAGDADPARRAALKAAGARVVAVERDAGGKLSLSAILAMLAGEGITRLLVEGGAGIAASLLDQDLIDEAVLIEGRVEIGEKGLYLFAGRGLEALTSSQHVVPVEPIRLGEDVMRVFRREDWQNVHRDCQ